MKFVDFNRSFIPFKEDEEFNPDFGFYWGKNFGGWLDWPDLLKRPRVILLGEASSGSSYEFLHQNEMLRAHGKVSFLFELKTLRLEDSTVWESKAFPNSSPGCHTMKGSNETLVVVGNAHNQTSRIGLGSVPRSLALQGQRVLGHVLRCS